MLLFRPNESDKSIALLHNEDISLKKKLCWSRSSPKTWTDALSVEEGFACLDIVLTLMNSREDGRNLGISKHLFQQDSLQSPSRRPYQKDSGRQKK